MKRIIPILLALCFAAMPLATAQNRTLERAQQRQYKAKMREFKKGGWQLYGSSSTMEVALLTHYDKLRATSDGTAVYEIMGECTEFKSKNVGHQTCINNACILYAQAAGREVKGRIVNSLSGNADIPEQEFDRLYAAYESSVQKEINGELQESFSIIRQKPNGNFEMQTYFVVNEDAATKARIRAFENAVKEEKAAQKYAEQVSSFVREAFVPAAE